MPIKNEAVWAKYVEANQDPYGKAIIDVAREAMIRLDVLGDADFDAKAIILQADKESGAGGITGYMAGAVAFMISQLHTRGEEFKRKWNMHYGVEDEEAGVVNPAILKVKMSSEDLPNEEVSIERRS